MTKFFNAGVRVESCLLEVNMRASVRFSPAVVLLTFALVGTCVAADIVGSLRTADKEFKGRIRWDSAAKAYMVTEGNIQRSVPLNQVIDKRIPKPAGLDQAIAQVQAGSGDKAIPVLEQIMRDYEMLDHDLVAAGAIALAYMQAGTPQKAMDVSEKVLRTNPSALTSIEFAATYWDALIKTEQYTKLERSLASAVQEGSRSVSALALMKRGDMLFQKNNFKEALIDGYLRVADLYQTEKALVPEALYKGAQCFERLNQINYAERLKKKLLTEFPDDAYSSKLKTGSAE